MTAAGVELARMVIGATRDDPVLAADLAAALRPHLGQQQPFDDSWLTSDQAAAYIGLTRTAMHKLTSEHAIPFEQEGPGCNCYFKRSELDDWRRGGGARAWGATRA
jgi:excisionase family DNA binding protein